MNSFYSVDELLSMGFKSIGSNVMISRKSSFYGISNISIGSNVRIDDFCILSGKITIGSNVHISAYNAFYGEAGITVSDYCGVSPRCSIFSVSDDFSGEYMVGAVLPEEVRNVKKAPVFLDSFSQVGAGCVILPGVKIYEGGVVGAMSLVTRDIEEWSIYAGIPAKKIKDRSKNLLLLKNKLPQV